MKKRIAFLFLIISFALCVLCGCGDEKQIAEKTPLNTRYTESQTTLITSMIYNGTTFIPYMYPFYIPEKYEVLYLITYLDGNIEENWISVDKEEYEQAKSIIEKENS